MPSKTLKYYIYDDKQDKRNILPGLEATFKLTILFSERQLTDHLQQEPCKLPEEYLGARTKESIY